jgi:hypothetical protein
MHCLFEYQEKREISNMKRLILFCATFFILLLAACSAQPAAEQTVEEGDGPIVTVYRAPT